MKLKTNDDSFKSISILEKKFSNRLQSNVWTPDWGEIFPENDKKNYDILLMGSFFERIFQKEYWPVNDFNLYCLSAKSKKALNEVLFLENDQIGLLSRYSLFPKNNLPQKFDLNNEAHFFYSGKISPRKNIEFLILTIFHLQILYSSKIRLTILGDFDNSYHKDILGVNFVDYKVKITHLIENLPWAGSPPNIISGLSENEWTKHVEENGIIFSTSNLISEDFSVSIAQAQEQGFPLLLPDWGGFSDARGENVRHYPESYIADSHQSLPLISKSALIFAQDLIKKSPLKILDQTSELDFIPLQKMSRLDLDKILKKNISVWGEEINLIAEGKLDMFTATKNGQNFFKALRAIYSSSF